MNKHDIFKKHLGNLNEKLEDLSLRLLNKLQEILTHERGHFNFYLQASMVCRGPSRLYIKPLFEKEMASELEHIRQFGDKIVAMGEHPTQEVKPVFCGNDFKGWLATPDLVKLAVEMERAVLRLYHEVYPLAEEYGEAFGDMSVALLIEENIEHTTADVEELEKLVSLE